MPCIVYRYVKKIIAIPTSFFFVFQIRHLTTFGRFFLCYFLIISIFILSFLCSFPQPVLDSPFSHFSFALTNVVNITPIIICFFFRPSQLSYLFAPFQIFKLSNATHIPCFFLCNTKPIISSNYYLVDSYYSYQNVFSRH